MGKLPETQRRRRGHQFFPTKAAKLPGLYATEPIALADKIIRVHYFAGSMDWYIAEFNPETGIAFGYADLGYGGEWGLIDLAEIEKLSIGGGIFRQPIERDMWYPPRKFSEIGR